MDLTQVFNVSRDLLAILDLNGTIRNINQSYLRFVGKSSHEVVGRPCHFLRSPLCKIEECPFNQVVTRGESVEIEMVKRDCSGKVHPMLLTATPFRSRSGEIIGMIEAFKDISMLKNTENQLRRLFSGMLRSMSEVVEIRDPYTAGHQQRVNHIAGKIAQKIELSEKRLENVNIAAMIHDIGKVYVPLDFLTKPGRLSDIEFEVIKKHVTKGYEILKPIPFGAPIATIVRQHHERMDGSGYPDGLTGEMILQEARIIAVADVVEAISSHRPYRPSLGMEVAMGEIKRGRGLIYDADVVDACLEVMQCYEQE